MGRMEDYEKDFEVAMLNNTSVYYSRKASSWILEDSLPDYMLKVWFLLTHSFFIFLISFNLIFNFFTTGRRLFKTRES